MIEDWLLSYFYQHPKGDHSTVSLLRELDGILKAEPSGLEKYNKHQKLFNAAEVTAEEYEALRTPKLEEVQKAVETLIEGGWVKGKRDADTQGMVFFTALTLTSSGEREAIRKDTERKKQKQPPNDFESRLRKARARVEQPKEGTKEPSVIGWVTPSAS
jgi:hypothetical protein